MEGVRFLPQEERRASVAGDLGRPLRILVVTNLYPTGEHPDYGTFIAEQVDAVRGHPSVACADVLFIDGRESRLNYLRGIIAARRHARGGPYDLIHAHHGLAGAVATAQSTLPVVVTYHGGDLNYFPVQHRLSRLAARRAALNICVSREGISLLGAPALHLPCGIDTATFAPLDRGVHRARHGVPEGALALLFPGRPDRPEKGYNRFAATLAVLAARGHTVHELRLERTPRAEVPGLMSAADVMLLTSVAEGAPITVMEALAAGLPVVATDVGDVAEMLRDAPNCHVGPFDAESFATAVESVRSDGLRTPMPGAHRYEQERIADRLASLYAWVVSTGGGRGATMPE
jgi:teichuronic acid biosynthesis glycosyltransferase TuaC